MKLRLGFAIVLLMGTLLACKAKKPVVESQSPEFSKRTQQLLEKMDSVAFVPENVSYKSSVKVSSGSKSNSFKATIRIQKDSLIWMSIVAYGMEGARLLATPDSFFIINRIDKKNYSGNYAYLEEQLQIEMDFQTLQTILLGNALALDDFEKIRRSNDKDFYMLSSMRKKRLKKAQEKNYKADQELVFSNWVHPETYRLMKLAIVDLKYNQSATFEYSDFQEVEQYMVPHRMYVRILANQIFDIEVENSKFVINKPLKFPFKLNDKYDSLD